MAYSIPKSHLPEEDISVKARRKCPDSCTSCTASVKCYLPDKSNLMVLSDIKCVPLKRSVLEVKAIPSDCPFKTNSYN